MLGDRAAAEDCAQDAFERAYKKWPTWQPIAPAEAWVHRIAINAAVSYQRKMRLREVGEVIRRIGRPGLAPDPQELVEHRDLATALAKLPPKQAAAIVLRHYHGYTNRAIAQALGIPERTVASRLAVAKERLRVMLNHSYGPEAGIEEAAASQVWSPPPTDGATREMQARFDKHGRRLLDTGHGCGCTLCAASNAPRYERRHQPRDNADAVGHSLRRRWFVFVGQPGSARSLAAG